MTTTQETIESVRTFLAGKGPNILDMPDLEGMPQLYRIDGSNAFGLFDDDQIFPFTGAYMGTTDGTDKYLCFQCRDFDIMVDLHDSEADLNGIPEEFEDKSKSERIAITDEEFSNIMELVDDTRKMVAVDFAHGYRLYYDEDEEKLIFGGDKMYFEHEVLSIMDYGIPFGGIVIELREFSIFFRNYNTVETGGAC